MTERIYHPWHLWECYQHNFFGVLDKGIKKPEAEETYRKLLSNLDSFESALQTITSTWAYSCEHNLTNEEMNRIAWLGQASLALTYNIPSDYRNGFNLLTEAQQADANELAELYLNLWLNRHRRKHGTKSIQAN